MQGTLVFQCSCIIGLRSCSICLSVGLEDHQYLFSGGGHSPILCWILLGESGPSLMQNCIFQGLGIPFYSAHPPPLRKGPESRDVDLWNLTWLFSSVIQLSLCSCFPIARQIVCRVSTEISVRAKGKGGRYSLFLAMQCFNDAMFSCFDHAIFMWCLEKNIVRGTMDPGYWVYILNYLFDWIEFVFILASEIIQVSDSIPWVRCASGNVSFKCTATQFV